MRASGAYRQTDFILRRTDLNLATQPGGSDQFGRPVYGQLIQQGSLLTSDPGSNRRFAGFDQVWALNPDGSSKQFSATFSLDHEVNERVGLFGAYTWSKTTDNWMGLASGRPDAAVDPGLNAFSSGPWNEGTSDLDVPHRVAVGLSGRVAALTVTGTYRFRSALPFTAAYRAGVDANGDGSGLNDASFVPDDATVVDLATRWDCLSTALDQFVKRNSCRPGFVHALDIRLSLTLFGSGNRQMALVVDGFNLLESYEGSRDTALLLVDGSRMVTVDPATGNLDVPVSVNPRFGRKLTSTGTGRMLRVGFSFGGGAR